MISDVVVLGPMGDVGRDLGQPRCCTTGSASWARRRSRRSSSAVDGGRMNTAHHVVARDLAQLLRALPVDVEQHVAARRRAPLDRGPRRAVAVAVDLGVLEQLARGDHGLDRLARSMKW